jgi:hypothetical protein
LQNYVITNTTDNSFVRIIKDIPIIILPPATVTVIIPEIILATSSATNTGATTTETVISVINAATSTASNTSTTTNNIVENIVDYFFPKPVVQAPISVAGVSFYQNQNPTFAVNPENKILKRESASIAKTCPYTTGFYKLGSKNKDIVRIKKHINTDLGVNMRLTEKFDQELFVNLKKWQIKHKDIVLEPWEETEATGYFYKTSNWSMNYLENCPIPKYVLEKYKKAR